MIVPGQDQFILEDIRSARRFKVELPVVVRTRLHDQRGWIVDVALQGLKVRGIKAPPRTKVCVYYRNQFAEGIVRWSRMGQVGIVLDAPLRGGPLGSIWRRFQVNVDSFGKHRKQPPRPVFGRKPAK